MNDKIYLKDIAGYDEEKAEAKKIIEVLKNHEKYKKIGAYIPKGLILSENPGVGKTMLAKAIASESEVPSLNLKATKVKPKPQQLNLLRNYLRRLGNTLHRLCLLMNSTSW